MQQLNCKDPKLHHANSVANQPGWASNLGEQRPQERVYRSGIHDVDQLKLRLIEECEHFQQAIIGEAVKQFQAHVLNFAPGTRRTLWIQTLGVFDIKFCTDMQYDSHVTVTTFSCCCLIQCTAFWDDHVTSLNPLELLFAFMVFVQKWLFIVSLMSRC